MLKLLTTIFSVGIMFLGMMCLTPLSVMASGGGNHPHGGGTKNMGQAGGHGHESWPDTPPPYAGKRNQSWNDQAIIDQGKVLYVESCLDCHGEKGKGDGSMA